MTGKTLADWVPINEGLKPPPPMANDPLLGIPSIFKGPVGRIVAIDMNTGEHLWMIPHGDTATRDQEAFRNNPLMKGVTFDSNVGRRGQAAMAATSTLLFATGQTADNRPALFGIDKKTGKRVGVGGRAAARRLRTDDLPAPGQAVRRHPDQRRLYHLGAAVASHGRLQPRVVAGRALPRAPGPVSCTSGLGPCPGRGCRIDKLPAPAASLAG